MATETNTNYDAIIGKLQTFLDNLYNRNQDTDTFSRPTRAQIVKSAKTLSHEITKKNLRAEPKFFSSIEETLDNVFSIYQGLSAYSGASLFRAIQICFRKLMKSTQEVFIAYRDNELSLGEDEENKISKQIIGLAWKCCEEFEKVPIKNSTSIIERGAEISSLIEDALDEVKDFQDKLATIKEKYGMVKKDKEEIDKDGNVKSTVDDISNDNKKDDVNGDFEHAEEDEKEDEEEFDEDFEDDDMEILKNISQKDIELVDKVVAIIEKSNKITKLFVEMLKSVEPADQDDISQDSIEKVKVSESIINSLNELSKNVDDIASAIYPLPNITYCEAQLSYLDISIKNIVDSIKNNFKLYGFSSDKYESKLNSF
ncbi:hypothetical protein DICPUDRAFT_159142 [Dictyostelium purpureum]|uniref:Uncharacterized protein n=1 Tax=Dictyostelium purpureum TaxID=5786 RepID=F1A3D8_DICPU|nr:uncharacterized protein DICPUDRAFT_159142 [Dictyostelium purpureum]EGC29299.1 hypothetical protein DICPUDRAFT_159142 [Dictyostelium purpureum]|eukprot:XP_003294182.1 hypothetical protein DICPUDRAFT_159142 [Dictyostelium purpureum]